MNTYVTVVAQMVKTPDIFIRVPESSKMYFMIFDALLGLFNLICIVHYLFFHRETFSVICQKPYYDKQLHRP